VLNEGTGAGARRAGFTLDAAGKSGTTNDLRDAWFVGFTPEWVVVVWVGHDRGGPLGLTGGQAALPIWSRIVSTFGASPGSFAIPKDVTRSPVCSDSLLPARDACPVTYGELFPRDAVPKDRCDLHGGPVVDVARGLRRLFGRRDDHEVDAEAPAPAPAQ
jgi:penicillin-binding protein 1B